MQWNESIAVKLVITQIPKVDPVTVFIENFGHGRGKLTIESFGEAWSSYWPAMGDGCTLEQFILNCDNHYLSKNLATLGALTEPDYDAFIAYAKRKVVKERYAGMIDKNHARQIWTLINDVCPDHYYFEQASNWDILSTIGGDDWSDHIPKRASPLYSHLCRILDALKACLIERGINIAAS